MNFKYTLAAAAAFAAVAAAAPSEAQTAKPVVKLCTGGSGGAYEKAGNVLARQSGSVQIQVVQSEGSLDNYDKMASGECDAAIVQNDADIYNKNYSPKPVDTRSIALLGVETTHLICGKDVDVGEVDDLQYPNITLAVGGGAKITYENMQYANEDYKIPAVNYMSTPDALTAVTGHEVDCAMVVMAQGAPLMMDIERNTGDTVKMADVDDGDVTGLTTKDGKPVYEEIRIPKAMYPQINGGYNIDSIGGPARLVIANSAFAQRDADRKVFSKMVQDARRAIIEVMTPSPN